MIPLSLFLVAVITAALALFVWRARPDSIANRWFAAFTISGAGWVLGVAGLHVGTDLDAWGRFTFASASLIPATFLCFSYSYPTVARQPSAIFIRVILFTGVAFSLLSLSTPLVVYDVFMTTTGLSRKTGPLYPSFALYFVATWTAASGISL